MKTSLQTKSRYPVKFHPIELVSVSSTCLFAGLDGSVDLLLGLGATKHGIALPKN